MAFDLPKKLQLPTSINKTKSFQKFIRFTYLQFKLKVFSVCNYLNKNSLPTRTLTEINLPVTKDHLNCRTMYIHRAARWPNLRALIWTIPNGPNESEMSATTCPGHWHSREEFPRKMLQLTHNEVIYNARGQTALAPDLRCVSPEKIIKRS